MQGLTQDTYLFTTQELCVIFAQAITEIKEGEVILPVVDANKKAREEPYGVLDFAKALQIVAHELYLEKQHQNMRYNCYNSSFLKNKVKAYEFCTTQLETMLDLTLWDNKIQVQTCVDSLKLLEHLNETNTDCMENIDSDECDPCTKHYDYFFDKYDVFVLQNILHIIQRATEIEQDKIDGAMQTFRAQQN